MKDSAAAPGFDFSRLRIEYMQRSLDENDAAATPIEQFSRWLTEAIAGGAHEPNAMTLATATPGGLPSARIVLLKNVDERGFTFFTNYLSRKGRELAENPHAALVFYWPELERQIRVEGVISKTSSQESAEYFSSRPVDARFGSASSPQSTPIESRQVLDTRQREFRSQYPDGNIPCPPHWGGYRLSPVRAEFWQGRPSRLHDRVEYLADANGQWKKQRLAP